MAKKLTDKVLTQKTKYWLIAYFAIGVSLLIGLSYGFYGYAGVPLHLTMVLGGFFFTVISISFGYMVWWIFAKSSLLENQNMATSGFLRIFAFTLSFRLAIFLALSAFILIKKLAFGHYLFILFLIYYFYALFFELIPFILLNEKSGRG